MEKKDLKKLISASEVPGISSPGRKFSKREEEIEASLKANEGRKKKEDSQIELEDITVAAYLSFKGHPPTLSQKGGRINFIFPNNRAVRICLDVYKVNPSIALAESVAALRILESQVAAMRKQIIRR